MNFFDNLAQALWIGLFSDGTWIKIHDVAFFALLGIVGYIYFDWSDKRKLDEVNDWNYPGTREQSRKEFTMHRAGLIAQIAIVVLVYIAIRNWTW